MVDQPVEIAVVETDQPSRLADARSHHDLIAGFQTTPSCPSTVSIASSRDKIRIVTRCSGIVRTVRAPMVCGQMGVTISASTPGWTMGPPADKRVGRRARRRRDDDAVG